MSADYDSVRGGFSTRDIDQAIGHCTQALQQLDGARLFITGGTGFLGRWLLTILAHARTTLKLNLEVVALTRNAYAFRSRYSQFVALPWLTLIEGDIVSFDWPTGQFSHVIHAATDTAVEANARHSELSAAIIDGTRRVLAWAAHSGVRRFLYLSSGAVYGRQPSAIMQVAEAFPGAPDPFDLSSTYGSSKRAAELWCRIISDAAGFEAMSARVFAAVGPGLPLDAHFAIGNFIRDVLCDREIIVNGDGTPLRSYLYAGDLSAWLIRILTDGAPGTAYNVGSDQAISIGELALKVAATLGAQKSVRVVGKADPLTPRARYIPSIGLARTSLGLDVWTSLEDAIVRTAESHGWSHRFTAQQTGISG